jgi:hypothetical protein
MAAATTVRTHRQRCRCETHAPRGFLLSGDRIDGEVWTCPRCGQEWVHECDEADGCTWTPR